MFGKHDSNNKHEARKSFRMEILNMLPDEGEYSVGYLAYNLFEQSYKNDYNEYLRLKDDLRTELRIMTFENILRVTRGRTTGGCPKNWYSKNS
ncbi:MAG: hypothetical protein MJA83_15875 [Gammaproteobacteria bacterium]|nr:hypothetical protein [Gammaproteobacteria bacterium]